MILIEIFNFKNLQIEKKLSLSVTNVRNHFHFLIQGIDIRRIVITLQNKTAELEDKVKQLEKQLKIFQMAATGQAVMVATAAPVANSGKMVNSANTFNNNINNSVSINVGILHSIHNSDYSEISIREIKDCIDVYDHPSDFIPILLQLTHFNKFFLKITISDSLVKILQKYMNMVNGYSKNRSGIKVIFIYDGADDIRKTASTF